MWRAAGIPLGIGAMVGTGGVIIALIFRDWTQVSNALNVLAFLCFCMLLFGLPSSGHSDDRNRIRDGFRNREEREKNRKSGMNFGLQCTLTGVPILLTGIFMYVIH